MVLYFSITKALGRPVHSLSMTLNPARIYVPNFDNHYKVKVNSLKFSNKLLYFTGLNCFHKLNQSHNGNRVVSNN